MNTITKRMLLFLVGCIGTRSLLVLLCKNLPIDLLPFAGYVALLPAFGFAYLYLTGWRKKGYSARKFGGTTYAPFIRSCIFRLQSVLFKRIRGLGYFY